MPYHDTQPAPRMAPYQGGSPLYVDPLQAALQDYSQVLGTPPPNSESPYRPEIPRQPWPPISPQNPLHNNPALQQSLRNNPYPPVQDLPGIPNLPSQGMPQLPPLQGQFNNPGNNAMPAGSMQSPFPGENHFPFPGGNAPIARPSGRPKLPDPPQPPRQSQGTPPQRGPFGQTFGERQY